MGKNDLTQERVVKHKLFTYHVVETDGVLPDGSIGDVTIEHQARRGDTVKLREADANRGDAADAFYSKEELSALEQAGATPGDVAPPPPAETAQADADLVTLDQEATTAWLQGEGVERKPSIPQVLNAVNSAPEGERVEVAQRVLDAENARGDTEPRKSLVESLESFIEDSKGDDGDGNGNNE